MIWTSQWMAFFQPRHSLIDHSTNANFIKSRLLIWLARRLGQRRATNSAPPLLLLKATLPASSTLILWTLFLDTGPAGPVLGSGPTFHSTAWLLSREWLIEPVTRIYSPERQCCWILTVRGVEVINELFYRRRRSTGSPRVCGHW